ncbi:alkyl sulfatase C-terminal domain-containing protein [Rhodococcus sp. NPDC055024]
MEHPTDPPSTGFDYLGIHIVGERAATVDIRINTTFTDIGDEWTMWVRNGVLNARRAHHPDAQLTIAGPKPALAAVLLQPHNAKAAIEKFGLSTEGDPAVLDALADIVEDFDPHFNIVTP